MCSPPFPSWVTLLAQIALPWTQLRYLSSLSGPRSKPSRICNDFWGSPIATWCFFQGFHSIARPLTALLKKRSKHLDWNPTAEAALRQLKTAFTTATILKHSVPKKPVVVEVDASEKGLGAILSQCLGEKPKLHPVALAPVHYSFLLLNLHPS